MDSKEAAIIETVIKNVVFPLHGQAALTKALSLWENEFKSSNNRFSWRAFCTRFSREHLDAKSNELYHQIVRENVAVRSGNSGDVVESICSENKGAAILFNVWSEFFQQILLSCSEQDKNIVFQIWPDEIKKIFRNKHFDAAGWLNAVMDVNDVSVPKSGLDEREIKKLTSVLYSLACEDFNPVIVDKAISRAIEIVQASPSASGAKVRQVLF